MRPKALLDNCLKVMRMLYGVPCEWGPGRGGGGGTTTFGNGGATCGGPVPRGDACPPLPRSVGVHLTPQKTPCLMPSPYPGAWDAASAQLRPPSRAPWGGSPRKVQRGNKCHPLQDQTPSPSRTLGLSTAMGSAPSEMPGTFYMGGGWGGLRHSPHHGQATAGCGEGGTRCPARSRGEGIARFLSVCIFSSAFIKHQLIL